MMKYLLLFWIMGSLACNSRRISWAETTRDYEPTEADIPFAGIYEELDGTWVGKFYVYRDTMGQRAFPVQPRDLSAQLLASLPLVIEEEIDVEQVYASETPYYQRVEIQDTYPDADGNPITLISTGSNKVVNGKLYCVVNKPSEQVIHTGNLRGNQTILWERSEKNPLRIEFFQETVDKDQYSIIGWGYYGNDDPTKSPRTWFGAVYQRVK